MKAARLRPSPLLGASASEVAHRLRGARRLLLLLDFDGTLAPLRPRREQARLPSKTGALLNRLARHPRIAVWIISGRSLRDLRARFGRSKRIHCLGVYGADGSAGAHPAMPAGGLDTPSRRALRTALRALSRDVANLAGVWIENKRLSFALHYRGARAREIRRARVMLDEALRPRGKWLRVLAGKKVWEVLPRAIQGKGAAVGALARSTPSALVVYIGDDNSDEEAFRALKRGITIRVGGRGESRARYSLRNPAEVCRFLEFVAAESD